MSSMGPIDDATETELRAMLDQFAISTLQATYGDAVTRRAWDEVTEMFVPDCPVHVDVRGSETRTLVGGRAVAEFIATSIERFEFFEFALLNSVVDVTTNGDHGEPGGATGRLYMWELRQDRETGRWSNAYGLYRDRYQRIDGGWFFAERRYSSLARTDPDGDGMLVFQIPGK